MNEDSKKIKVLGYADLSKLERMMDRHFFETLYSASDEVTQDPRTISELNDYISSEDFTHVLIPDEHFHRLEGSLKDCKVPVVEFLQDHWIPWAVERKIKYIKDNGIEHVITFSPRFLEPYKGVANFYPCAVGYNSKVFVDQEKERDIDVLVSGAQRRHEPWVYPVRNWLSEVVPEIGEKEGLRIFFQEHPGYFPEDGRNYEQEYADLINRTKISTGGSSYWRLPLKKFYEIPASGAVLLTDLPIDNKDFFEGRVIEVDQGKIHSKNYKDVLRKDIMDILENYEVMRNDLQPFRGLKDRFERSYEGRSQEMRRIISGI